MHLDDARTPDDFVQSGLRRPGLVGAVSAGYGPERSALARRRVAGSDRVWRTVAPHPWWLAAHTDAEREAAWQQAEAELTEPGVVAVGEIGLDQLKRRDLPLELQLVHLRRGLSLARRHDLPVVLHVVRWQGHALDAARRAPPPGGVMHRYGGPVELVVPWTRLGVHLSLDTQRWRRAPDQVRAIAAAAPPALWVVETDWPLSHRPWAAALDELEAMVRDLAAHLGQRPHDLAAQLVANARALYRL